MFYVTFLIAVTISTFCCGNYYIVSYDDYFYASHSLIILYSLAIICDIAWESAINIMLSYLLPGPFAKKYFIVYDFFCDVVYDFLCDVYRFLFSPFISMIIFLLVIGCLAVASFLCVFSFVIICP